MKTYQANRSIVTRKWHVVDAEGKVVLDLEAPEVLRLELLIHSFTEHFRAKIARVVVTDVKNSTYYAAIHLVSGETERTVDSRPSDAIALALRTNCPIYVTQDVLKRRSSAGLDLWLEKLDVKDFGKYQVFCSF